MRFISMTRHFKKIASRQLIAALALGTAISANLPGFALADEGQLLPFFGRPYPFGYAYNTRPPRPCWTTQRVDGFFGPAYERVWICDNVVTSRY